VNRLAIGHDAGHYLGGPAFAALQRRDRARAFRAAMRHSRVVRTLRVVIPTCAVFLAVGVGLLAWFDPLRLFGVLPVRLSDLVISGTKIKMEQPRLSGYTRDSRPYDLTAQFAQQDLTAPDVIELSGLRAKLRMQDTSTVEMSAATGLFNTKSEVLNLNRDIVVRSSAGFQGNLTQAVVDTRQGNLVSDKPVTIKTDTATISSNGLEIEKSGDLVRFKGGVAVTLTRPLIQGRATERASQ
jgi:lipopolysaccharide export system protein LptC